MRDRVVQRVAHGIAVSVHDARAGSPTQLAGFDAETLALEHLRSAGLQLVARNVRCRAGEIDLVMRDGAECVFVEVRSRAQARYGGAAASIGFDKQRRLRRAAQWYLAQRFGARRPPPCRFDVVAIDGDRLEWIRAAFA